MSFLDTIKNSVSGAKDALTKEVAKYRSKDLMQAIVAGATLIAYADGEITAAEKQKLIGFFRNSEQLKVFETDRVIEVFNAYVGKYEFDATIATGEVLQAIVKFKGKSEAQLIVHVSKAIALADGHFDTTEKRALGEICTALGLNLNDFV